MATTKYVDQNSLIYIFTKIKENFVAKEAGKGLSANDFTNDLKSKLEGIAAGAQVNVIETVKVNGVAQTVTEKGVDIKVPVKTSEITNDSGFLSVVSESNLDSALAEKVNAAAEGNHSHSNKTVLDGITAAKVADWDDAVTKEHEHSNKALLDTYTQTEANLADAVAKKHSHTNATVLDGITSAKVAGWDTAAEQTHTHANAEELALIASGDKAKWDAAASDTAAIKADYLKAADKTELSNSISGVSGRVADIEADYLTSADKYNDAALAGRVKAIEDDYLTSEDAYDDTALAGRVSTVEGKVSAIEADYLTSADKYDDTALAGRVKTIEDDYLKAADKTALQGSIDTLAGRVGTNEQAIATLNGTGEGSVDKKITDAINDFSTKVTDDGVVNSYKELIDYAAEHGSEFTKLVGDVTANTNEITSIKANYVKASDMVALTNSEIDEAFDNA